MHLEVELAQHITVMEATVERTAPYIADVVNRLCCCLTSGGKVLFCGNGGSAADAQHIAAEFVNRLRLDRKALPALALTTDTSILTCIANDSDYRQVFARQVEALGRKSDILVGLSTSGSSPNVLAALGTARSMGLTTIGFTGDGGVEPMGSVCDVVVAASSCDCARIQEAHEFLWHAIAGNVESQLFGGH